MERKSLFIAVAITALLGVSIVSCSPVAVSTPEARERILPTTTATQVPTPKSSVPVPTLKAGIDEPRYGGVVTRGVARDVASFDVQREQGADASQTLFNVYEGLVRLHPTEHHKILPELAEAWEISPDGTTYTFRLSRDVKWHDGKPLTIEDVTYSLDRMQNPAKYKTVSPRGQALLTAMDKVVTAGDNIVKLTTKYPSASFLPFVATGWVAIEPKHILVEKGDMRSDLIGTGPFKLKQFNPNVSFELEKNNSYHIKGMPYLDGIKFYTLKDGAARFAAFRTGRTQTTFLGSAGLTPTEAEAVRRDMVDKAEVYEHDSVSVHQIDFNLDRKPWNDVRVRKAVDLAFDRQAAVKVAGSSYLSSLYVGAWARKAEEMEKLPGRRQPKDSDITEAKNLMALAGFGAGLKTTILIFPGQYYEQQAVVAKDQLAWIGIDAEINILERAVYDDRVNRRAFDLLSISWGQNTDDPDETLFFQFKTGGTRNFGFSSGRVDELIEKESRTLDEAGRRATLKEIEDILLDQVPVVFLFTRYNLAGAWKEVRNFNPGPGIHPWGKFDQVWLAK